jgi:hypothetical protein
MNMNQNKTAEDRTATIADWRAIGALFGAEIARAAKHLVHEGKSPAQVNEHVRGMIAVKEESLRQIGGDAGEIAAFMDAAGETAARSVLVAELFGRLNRRQRRAIRS